MTSFKEGDYFYTHGTDDEGKEGYTIFRCLKIDPEFEIAHVSLYAPLEKKPQDTGKLELHTAHLPIDLEGFDDPVVFANTPVKKDELDGYFAYLKMADFEAYLDESGADADALAQQAEELFERATELSDKEEYEEAADLYYQAYETFPLYHEALDNAGLCLLDAEQFEHAISCFEESIEVNGNTFMTDFSIAQAYHAMDQLDEAEEWYLKAKALPGLSDEEKAAIDEVLLPN